MILQRLATSIRKQDWFTVLIETLIVVLGVFLGLQVNNWNDARLASAQEAELLDRLTADMTELETEFSSDLRDFELTRRNTGVLLDVIRSGEAPQDEDELLEALWAANYYYELPSLSPVFQEIITGAGLSSLSDPELRNALSHYGDLHERLLRDAVTAKPVFLDPQSQYLKAVSWSSNAADWDSPETAIVAYDWDSLTSAEPELQAWLAYQNDAVRGADQTLDEIRVILTLLEDKR